MKKKRKILILRFDSFSPLKKLLAWINSIVPGKPVPPLNNETKITEFKQLNDAVYTINRLNYKAYLQQKQFTENVAHELQTPLAIAINKLDQFTQNKLLTEKQLSEIDQIYRSLNHSVKLNKSLLLLSRIENNQFPERSNVNINSLILKTADDLAEIYEYKNIELIIDNKEDCFIFMNETLSEILISNLLKNAFIHTESSGRIIIQITKNKLFVKNSGEKYLDGGKIFEHFYKSPDKKENSTGLGLSIVKSICSLYRFDISYQFMQEHIFTIKF